MSVFAITGASGFIGRALMDELVRRGMDCIALARGQSVPEGTDVVIDVAGLAHSSADEAEFMQANCHRPRLLLDSARAQGARRFIFVSSVAAAAPINAYGRSKRAGEEALLEAVDDIETVILRPPLVYGPGAPASFGLLTRLSRMPVPLPFGKVDNRRSLIGRNNLVDAIIFLATRPVVTRGIYTATDGEAQSLATIIAAIRAAHGMRRGLFGVPAIALRAALRLVGKADMASQLLDDLVFDDTALRALGWTPPLSPLAPIELRVA